VTRESHPGDPVLLTAGAGLVGVMPCPGRYRPVEADVAALHLAGVAELVSLIETRERPETIAALPDLLADADIRWRHLPIGDYGVPSPVVDAELAPLIPVWSAALSRGEGIVFHCHGGRGRSGMLALRLMIEAGEDPAAALARLRAVRPGAVETGPQQHWATAGRLPSTAEAHKDGA